MIFPRAADAGVARAGEAAVFLGDDANTGVAGGPRDVGSAIPGAVVDDHHLEVAISLGEHRLQRQCDVSLCLIERNDDADANHDVTPEPITPRGDH